MLRRITSCTCQRGKGLSAGEGGGESNCDFYRYFHRALLPSPPPALGHKDPTHNLGREKLPHTVPPPPYTHPSTRRSLQADTTQSLPNPSSKLFPQQIWLRKPANPAGRSSSWGKYDVADSMPRKQESWLWDWQGAASPRPRAQHHPGEAPS